MINRFLVKKPLITEKAGLMGAMNKYVFLVDGKATSSEVKKILTAEYKVKIDRVQMINVKPKKNRFGRNTGIKPGYKKAIVTLKKGEKLDIINA